MSVLFFALVTTSTVVAQRALPGKSLYNWKLASESLWRAMAGDPLGVDLKLSDRRIHEYVAVSSDQQRRTEVLTRYTTLLARFQGEKDKNNLVRIQGVLKTQQAALRRLGLSIPALDTTVSRGEFRISTQGLPAAISNP
jgi:hypothetical protein